MTSTTPSIAYGLVVSLDDPTGSGRIKVQIPYEDRNKNGGNRTLILTSGAVKNQKIGEVFQLTEDYINGIDKTYILAYAFPFNPKVWHIKPKVGEGVFILSQVFEEKNSQRFYIGPIVSQPQFMYYDDYQTDTRTLAGSKIGADENIEYTRTDEVKGILPKDDTVAVLGRKDSDIFLEDDTVYIRCGVKKTSESDNTEFSFNSQHPAFIKLQHQTDKQKIDEFGYESVVNIVADKINLIGTDSSEYHKISDKDNNLLSDKELNEFVKKAHEVPFGDVLVDFLKKFKTAFLNHQHKWAQLPPTEGTDGLRTFKDFDIDSMLSQTIKIN